MYTRTAILAVLAAASANAQKYCFSCTNNNPLGSSAETENGHCYFTSTLDATLDPLSSDVVRCDDNPADLTQAVGGQCFMKITTIDGIPQSIERGCVGSGEAAPTDAQVATATGLPSGHSMGCDIDIIGDVDGAALNHITGSLFNANQDINTLTDATCAYTVTAGSAPTNQNGIYEINTLDDCDAQCGTVSTCDHWTGVCRNFICSTGEQAKLENNEYVCEAKSCTNPLCGAATCIIGNTAAVFGDFVAPFCQCGANEEFQAGADPAVDGGTCEAVTVVTPETTNPKCLQCSSDTQTSGCGAGTISATECAAGQRCAAVSTLWIDSDGKSIREVVERGCTGDAVTNDVCEFQEINAGSLPSSNQAAQARFTGATEMTCRYVCEGDGCNSELADGQDDYQNSVQCATGTVCNSLATCKTAVGAQAIADITPAASACAGKCYSKMKYFQHMRTDGTYERAITHLEFGCDAESAMEDQHQCAMNAITYSGSEFIAAAQTDIISGVRGVVTQYECTSAMAETVSGWPGQPKCFACDSANPPAEEASNDNWCYLDVAMAEGCANYWDNACYVKQSGLDLQSNWAVKSMNPYSAMQTMGSYRSIMRGCTSATEASVMNDEPQASRDLEQMQSIYHDRMVTCMEGECNFGPALPTPQN